MNNKTRLDLVLPVSGGKLSIRKARWKDYQPLGEAPAALEEVAETKEIKKLTPAQLDYTVRATTIQLVNCTTKVLMPDGKLLRIVDKPIADSDPETEFTIEEMDDDDANYIIDEIHKFTGMSKEAAKAAKKFPEKQEPPHSTGLDSEALRETTNRSDAVVA